MEKKLKVMCLILAVLLAAASVFGCSGNASESKEPSETNETEASGSDPQGTHEITDHAGNTVTVPNTVKRVVVCDIYPLPSIISVFFDSADKIVGMAKQSYAAAKGSLLSELYPEILNAKTDFIDGTSVNMEELLKLNPDVVFYNAGNKALGEQLKAAGLAGVAFSAGKWKYDALETLNQWIKTLDDIFVGNGRYEKVQAYGESILREVTEKVQNISGKKRVFFLFQYTEEMMQSAGNPSFGAYWAETVGGDFVVKETTEANSLQVSMEQVYAWNPEVIFVTNFTTATEDDILNSTVGNYDWSEIDAVKNKRVYKMPLGMYRTYTSGADSPIALLWLAKACYPEQFSDVDITAETKAYYKDVFGIELTDAQADSIFNPDPEAGKMK